MLITPPPDHEPAMAGNGENAACAGTIATLRAISAPALVSLSPVISELLCSDRKSTRYRQTGSNSSKALVQFAALNDQQIVDLTAVTGNYVMVAMILAMAEQTVPPDKEEPFKPGEA
jgi:hypothetical protein